MSWACKGNFEGSEIDKTQDVVEKCLLNVQQALYFVRLNTVHSLLEISSGEKALAIFLPGLYNCGRKVG